MGTLEKTTFPKTTSAEFLAWVNNQINLAILCRSLSSQAKNECSLTNEKLLTYCYITGWESACCPMWMFGQCSLLIFHRKTWEHSMSSLPKVSLPLSVLCEMFIFSLFFIIIQWVWWAIVSNELTVFCNCYQTFHCIFKPKGWVIGSLYWMISMGIFWARVNLPRSRTIQHIIWEISLGIFAEHHKFSLTIFTNFKTQYCHVSLPNLEINVLTQNP